MSIITATEEQQTAVLRKAVILSYAAQRFAETATKLTVKQATTIDEAMAAMSAALSAAGVRETLPDSQVVVSDAQTTAVKNSAGADVPGVHTAVVSAGALTNIKLAATVAPVVSGLQTVAATGTGTKVTLTVAAGKISAIALSE